MVRSIYLSNLAIQRHGASGHLQQAFQEFAAMPARNDFSWRILLGASLQSDCLAAVMESFRRMPLADSISGTTLLGKLARNRGGIHGIDQSFAFFDDLPLRDVVSWNCMLGIAADAVAGAESDRMLLLFQRMPGWNLVSTNCLLAGFLRRNEEHEALDFFVAMPCRNIVSWTMLSAKSNYIFNLMPAWNIVSLNTALAAFARCGHHIYVFFEGMPEKDLVSWTILLKATVVEDGDLGRAQDILARMPWHDVVSATAPISGFPPDESAEILESMPIHDSACWNAMLLSCVRHGDRWRTYALFDRMPLRDLISWNILLRDSLGEQGEILAAEEIFQGMPQRNIVSWNTMLAIYAQQGDVPRAANVLDRMPEKTLISWTAMIVSCHGESADIAISLAEKIPAYGSVTWTAMLTVYAEMGYLEQAKFVFHNMPCKDPVAWNTLIAMYGSTGNPELAVETFDLMPMRTIVTWSASIVSNSDAGNLCRSLDLYHTMALEGIAANKVIFQCILSCCSHAGDLNAGIFLFQTMIYDYKFSPIKEHYSCLIDALGRAGRLGQARDLVEHMPFFPDLEWTSLTIHHYSTNTWRAGKWSLILPLGEILLDAACSA